jgi:hypothetical protein
VNKIEKDICSVAEKAFDAKMEVHNRKVALFIQHYPAHAQVELWNTEIILLPVNISLLHPLDQGVMGFL